MALTTLSSAELTAVSGGDASIVVPVSDDAMQQMVLGFLSTVSADELKRFIANNVQVSVIVYVATDPVSAV